MPARSGAEYLAGLRDGREIWFGGERVVSVPDDPILGRMARTLAELYDLQWNPAYQPRLTYPSPTSGDLVSLAFLEPRRFFRRQGARFRTLLDAMFLVGLALVDARRGARIGLRQSECRQCHESESDSDAFQRVHFFRSFG